MKTQEKREFVSDLVNMVRDDILRDTEFMPEA